MLFASRPGRLLLCLLGSAVHGEQLDVSMMLNNSSTLAATPPRAPSILELYKATQPAPQDSFHMQPVRAIHARVQSDAPVFLEDQGLFVSKVGLPDFEAAYTSAMDTVNTASVEGALMYVQAEGINYNLRGDDQRCQRKYGMKYIVFYEVAVAQTNETLALYQDTADQNEYGPMVPMDLGRCAPVAAATDPQKAVLPKECYYFNGEDGTPNVGPFVGGESKELDVRAPYPDNVWFSFPHTCPTKTWADKTPACRASTRRGLCPPWTLPDGVRCTFAYRVLGFIAIDDVVGITSMVHSGTGRPYRNFTEFCEDGGVEMRATQDGVWEEGLAFWQDPQNETANAARAQHLVQAYQNLTDPLRSRGSTQIDAAVVARMLPLPSLEALAASNPPCYRNVARCNTGESCRRETFSQLCRVCAHTDDQGCTLAPRGFSFPRLARAVGADGSTGSADKTQQDADRKKKTKETPRPTTRSASPHWRHTLEVPLALASVAAALVINAARR
ncbi:hypothetical protein P43SY_008415 [Pythium insidiosum]|uniref:Uncharacterized protein n=1 Tax=Pythium insidiosum TaxID=114742 RepID=A0AAD5LST8_PYTIN|nr:hypothetical protein P43SY_008415 [Pythium insidiosum]